MTVELREIEPRDQAALETFFVENNRPEITETFHPFPLDAANAERIAVALRRDRYFAAFIEDTIVGLGMLRGWDEGFEVPSFGVVVDYRAQGQGHGRALTAHALRLARELGSERVRLTVHPSNARAVALYESLGFRETGRNANGYGVMTAELHE
jgi:ribosomal protein S18 acetylase RimI-like enzyme